MAKFDLGFVPGLSRQVRVLSSRTSFPLVSARAFSLSATDSVLVVGGGLLDRNYSRFYILCSGGTAELQRMPKIGTLFFCVLLILKTKSSLLTSCVF